MRYDAAGGGGDSIELNRGNSECALWEIIFFKTSGTCLQAVIHPNRTRIIIRQYVELRGKKCAKS